jgi:histidine triad (HIT) family protein
MPDCVFCDILAGRKPGSFVHRDDLVAAIMDIQPVNAGHHLVMPVAHAPSVADLQPETAARMFVVAQRLVAATRASGLPCDGVNLLLADGASAGQEVFHAHLHVIPRLAGDGFGFRRSKGHAAIASREDLDRAAEAIRGAAAAE